MAGRLLNKTRFPQTQRDRVFLGQEAVPRAVPVRGTPDLVKNRERLLRALRGGRANDPHSPAKKAAREKDFLAANQEPAAQAAQIPGDQPDLSDPRQAAMSRRRGLKRRKDAGLKGRQKSAFESGSRANQAALERVLARGKGKP